jgi:hypothetical protein
MASVVVPEEDIAQSSHSRPNLHIQRKLPQKALKVPQIGIGAEPASIYAG